MSGTRQGIWHTVTHVPSANGRQVVIDRPAMYTILLEQETNICENGTNSSGKRRQAFASTKVFELPPLAGLGSIRSRC